MECPHQSEQPPWKTGARQELVKTLMDGDKAMYQREQLGVVTTQGACCLDTQGIDWVCKRENYYDVNTRALLATTGRENVIFCVVDPCGGGASCFAILTIAVIKGRTLVIGGDAEVVDSDELQESFLHRHLAGIRRHFFGQEATIVLIVEKNYGGSVLASRVASLCAKYGPMMAMTMENQINDGGNKRKLSVAMGASSRYVEAPPPHDNPLQAHWGSPFVFKRDLCIPLSASTCSFQNHILSRSLNIVR